VNNVIPISTAAVAASDEEDDGKDYSQPVVDKQMRRTIVEVCRMPVGELRSLSPEQIQEMPSFKAMWITIMLKASHDTKPDMRAAEFVQEHLAGKAIQRIQSHTTTVTYQDLLKKIGKDEDRFQQVVTVEVTEATNNEPMWDVLK